MFFLLIILSKGLTAQETFVKSYDFFDGADESVRNMFIIGEELHILGRGDCVETKCLHYYVLDINGEVLWTQRYPDIWPTLYGFQRDSSIYLGGFLRSDTIDDGYRVFELNLDAFNPNQSTLRLNIPKME